MLFLVGVLRVECCRVTCETDLRHAALSLQAFPPDVDSRCLAESFRAWVLTPASVGVQTAGLKDCGCVDGLAAGAVCEGLCFSSARLCDNRDK